MFKTLSQSVVRFTKQEDGVTAVECALLLALVVTICVVVITPNPANASNLEPVIEFVE